jgi:hypothetical protein
VDIPPVELAYASSQKIKKRHFAEIRPSQPILRRARLRQANRGPYLLRPAAASRPRDSVRDGPPGRQTASDNDEKVKSLTFIGGTR